MGEEQRFISRNVNAILCGLTAVIGAITSVVIVYNLTHDVEFDSWFTFWKYYMSILFLWTFPVTIWFIVGGIFDLKRLFKILREEIIDEKDDGIVREGEQ